MKKLFTVLAVLLVATALFAAAGVTAKVGGTFAFANLNSATDSNSEDFAESMNMKSNAFGFDVGAQYDIADNLAVYADFVMVFPTDATMKDGGEEKKLSVAIKELEDGFKTIDEDASVSYKLNFFSVSAGVAYKLDFNAVKLAVGGGLTLNRATMTVNGSAEALDEVYSLSVKQTFTNIGLNALVDAKYMFNDNIGVGVALNPQLGLYNITKASMKMSEALEAYFEDYFDDGSVNGFKVNFAMPITVGVSYTF